MLATSAGKHTNYYQLTIEDAPMMLPGMGGAENAKVRADMTYMEMRERRRRLLGRLDQLVRQPADQRVRQQRLAGDGERAAAVHGVDQSLQRQLVGIRLDPVTRA